jgi:hypothetical protein
MARPEGFEPPTPWFEARYSIQLSYGRVNGLICPRSQAESRAGSNFLLMDGCNNGFYVSPNAEIAYDFDFPGIKKLNQITQNVIGDVFVKYLLIAKTIDVELERLKFYTPLVRNVLNANRGEIRKAASWADAGELRAAEFNRIPPLKGSIPKAL